MNNKNLGIIITIVTILLCGLPGLISICSGVVLAFNTSNFDEPLVGAIFTLSSLCIGLIFVAIPVTAGLITFRNRSQEVIKLPQNEPIPPPS
jgi:hypothetical protein